MKLASLPFAKFLKKQMVEKSLITYDAVISVINIRYYNSNFRIILFVPYF